MRYQKKAGYCGPTAIQNAFRVHGTRISQDRIAVISKTNINGETDEYGMLEAIRHFEFVASNYNTDDPVAAWGWIVDCIRVEKPVIICTLNWRHWVTVVGMIGNKVIVIDPTTEKFNVAENGVHIQGKKDFMKRWAKNKDLKSLYYGISVGKK